MMKVTLCVLSLAATAVASGDFSSPVVDDDLIRRVNADPSSTWTAGPQPHFEEWSKADFMKLLGAKQSRGDLPVVDAAGAAVPSDFDWRNKSAVCTGPVRDQGECGSCWAVSSTNAIASRICIQGSGNYTQLSEMDMTTCDSGWFSGNNGCEGGQPSSAWSYAQSTGLVTAACQPYLKAAGGRIPTCTNEPCMPPTFVQTPKCESTCVDGSSYGASKVKISSVYGVPASVESIQAEIFKNGPVVAAFTVYSDFPAYKSGVYQVTQGATALGGHAVKVVGYGTENGVQYWLVQNSWTTRWGNAGYFKIGVNQCGISDSMVAGMA